MRITIKLGSYEVRASLFDTPTGSALYNALPIESTANTWGDEIYFETPVHTGLESDARAETAVGDLAFWPPMSAFCIFFGPTPASIDDTPMAASEVNIVGKLDHPEPHSLRKIRAGESIRIAKADG
jgi:hypothetical protein